MRLALFLGGTFCMVVLGCIAYAGTLTFVSDLISTSAPGAEATHTIQFNVATDIPASGKIVITPQDAAFTIPASFDFTDVDLAVSNGGPYIDRDISDTADALNEGVSVTSGSSGSITIILNSTSGISAGEHVQIRLGKNATFGITGTDDIINPSVDTSYLITLKTYDASNVEIDSGATMIAVVLPVGLSLTGPNNAPIRFNGLPSGIIAAGNTQIELSLETNIPSSCRYATSTGVLYDDMTAQFSTSLGVLLYTNTSGYQNATTYTYYVRCKSLGGARNPDDFPITFTLKPTPISNTSVESEGFVTNGETGDLGPGGSGDFSNGSAVLYLSSVRFSGYVVPNSLVTILKDGIKATEVQSKSDGTFSASVIGIERGAYGFQLYAQDGRGLASSLYGTTLSVQQGTDNDITGIVVPPTIKISADSIQAGDPITVSGGAPPNALMQVTVTGQTGGAALEAARVFAATSSPSGDWSVALDTAKYAKGTYSIQALAALSSKIKSGLSKSQTLAVGVNSSKNVNRSDINRDGKVNLVDFSILLSFWQTADADADINEDGTVNLGDFSIMLFNWTG